MSGRIQFDALSRLTLDIPGLLAWALSDWHAPGPKKVNGRNRLLEVPPVAIRKARAADVPGIAEVHISSWQAAYRGVLPDDLLDGLSLPEREQSWQALLGGDDESSLTLVAERNGVLLGFCALAMPSRDADAGERTAEIGALYVDPGFWRSGIGTALVEAVFDELRGQDWRQAILWVLPENERALSFYARFGFEVEDGIEKREERSGRAVIRLRARL